MKTYEFKTAKGATVKLTVSQNHVETINADGYIIEKTVNRLMIHEFILNGKEINNRNIEKINSKDCITFTFNGQNAAVELPVDIATEIMKETKERAENEVKAYKKKRAFARSVEHIVTVIMEGK